MKGRRSLASIVDGVEKLSEVATAISGETNGHIRAAGESEAEQLKDLEFHGRSWAFYLGWKE